MSGPYVRRDHSYWASNRGTFGTVPTSHAATKDRVDLAERLLLAGHDHKQVAKKTGLRGRVVRLIAWRLFSGETKPDISPEISTPEAPLHVA